LVTHPGTQQAYETVSGLHRAGMLGRFYTSVYGGRPASWRYLPPPLRSRIAAGLRRRRHPGVPAMVVEQIPAPFVAMRALSLGLKSSGFGSYAGIERLGDAWFDARVASRLRTRPQVTQVHAFEGSALRTFAVARELGLPAVLDAPAAHEYNIQLCAEEAREANARPPRRFGSPTRVAEERRLATCIVAPSLFVARCLAEHGVPDEKVVVVPFGADAELFQPAPARPPGGRLVLLCVASINMRKGTRYLLEAWRQLGLRDAELVLAGTPDAFGDGLLRRYDGSFRHLGHVPWYDLPALFRSASAFVLPSLAEGSALVTYMAMASGLPVIVTEDAGAVARHEIDGLVVPSRSVGALKEAILSIHERAERAAAMGREARRLIEQRFTWRHYHARTVALHRALLAGEDPRRAVEAHEVDLAASAMAGVA
jgi:glycosyltransferase involved in cell wall biosynthesis